MIKRSQYEHGTNIISAKRVSPVNRVSSPPYEQPLSHDFFRSRKPLAPGEKSYLYHTQSTIYLKYTFKSVQHTPFVSDKYGTSCVTCAWVADPVAFQIVPKHSIALCVNKYTEFIGLYTFFTRKILYIKKLRFEEEQFGPQIILYKTTASLNLKFGGLYKKNSKLILGIKENQ